MDVTFTNGGTKQKSLWAEAFDHLMNLPKDAIPVSIVVEFVDPGQVTDHGHHDLALTTWSYGSSSGSTKVRDDAISFGEQRKALQAIAGKLGVKYSTEPFYFETAIHELGHVLFAALPQENRVKIAQMFGAQTDSLSELQPAGVGWENQIIEGIAETFKEAFLPRRFRVFPNRTNRQIGYKDFPHFRKLWRVTAPAVPPIDIDFDNVFRVGTGSGGGFVSGATKGLWDPSFPLGVLTTGYYVAGSGIFNVTPQPAGPVLPGETLTVEWTIPETWFPDTSLFVPPFPSGLFPGGHRLGYFSLSATVGDRSFAGSWLRQTPGDTDGNPLTPDAPEWVLTGDAVALGNAFPITLDLSFENTTSEPVSVPVLVARLGTDGPYSYMRGQEWEAEGEPSIGPGSEPWMGRFIADPSYPISSDEAIAQYVAQLQSSLPVVPFHYHVPGVSGEPIVVPDARTQIHGGLRGGRIKRQPVTGSHVPE